MDAVELFQLGRWLTKLGEDAMRPLGVPPSRPGRCVIMRDALAFPDSSVGEIATRTGLPQSYVSEMVAKLRDLGAFETRADPADRRRTLVKASGSIPKAAVGAGAVPVDKLLIDALRGSPPGSAAEFVPGAPSFSHDGRWLAIPATSRVTAPNGDESTLSTLWLADADGSRLHKVTGFDNPEFLGWSPTSDVLAITNQGEVSTTYTPPPGSEYVTQPTSLWLVSPSGARRELVRPGSGMIDGATWSPDGSEVAVGGLSAYPFQDHVPWSETLTAYPIDEAKPTVWLRIVNPRSNSCCQTAG